MNYERTVKDFGHCPGHGRNDYNFPFVSHCITSGFDGPCKDSKYPVACGDNTCRSTYVECLRATNDLEKRREEVGPLP